jgi:hypothetical protein
MFFLNAHSLPLNCKIRKKRRIWISVFLFWAEMELFFFHFRKVVSLNDLDRVVQLARRGTLNKIRPRAICSRSKMASLSQKCSWWMIFQISEEEKKQKIKILSKMTLKLQGYGVANSILSIFFFKYHHFILLFATFQWFFQREHLAASVVSHFIRVIYTRFSCFCLKFKTKLGKNRTNWRYLKQR